MDTVRMGTSEIRVVVLDRLRGSVREAEAERRAVYASWRGPALGSNGPSTTARTASPVVAAGTRRA
jgi:hypothetical protein